MTKRTVLLFVALLLGGLSASAQQLFHVEASAELASGYIWRGDRVCGAQVSPSVTLHLGPVALQSFGYLALDGTYKEIDFDLSWTIGDFSLHFADYFYHGSVYPSPENYFNWKKGETTHILEGIVCYEPARLPFAVKWFTFLYGDWIPQGDGTLGRPSFSSYLEAEVYHRFQHAGKLSLFGGASVLKGSYTGYTRDFAVIHLEMRYSYDLELGRVTLPMTAGYIMNPYARHAYLNASIGVRF